MTERLFGIETEYGLVPGGPPDERVDWDALAHDLTRHALASVPSVGDSGHGLFAQNGSRFYVDAGHHPEWTTPEVANPWDAVRYVLAGERLLSGVAASLPVGCGGSAPSLFKTNVDYGSRATWGCHESVLHRSNLSTLAVHLIPFLVTRVIFTGSGGFNPHSPGLEFVLSPRAMFIERDVSADSTWHRALVHTKDETLCGHGYKRLHIICGESLNSEVAMWLRSATLVLAVAMIEGGVDLAGPVALDQPVNAFRALVRDPTCGEALELLNGSTVTAVEVQRHYLSRAEEHLAAEFMPAWAETACRHWRTMLDHLEDAPGSVATTLDWAIKHSVFTRQLQRRGFEWDQVAAWTGVLDAMRESLQKADAADDMPDLRDLVDSPEILRAHQAELEPLMSASGLSWDGLGTFARVRRELLEVDARFSQLSGDGVFTQLDREGVLTHHMPGVDNIEHAMEYPPAVGRAKLRGDVIRRVQSTRDRFTAGWAFMHDHVARKSLDLSHPFEREERWETSQPWAGAPERLPSDLLGALCGSRPRNTRDEARHYFVRGDLATAARLLEVLLGEGYERPSTLLHMARVQLVWSRHAEALECVTEAWALRGTAQPYVVARTLWFLVMFGMLDRADVRPWLGQLKTLLLGDARSALDWTMTPVLEYLRGRLEDSDHAFLTALVQGLCQPDGVSALETFALWREAEPRALD